MAKSKASFKGEVDKQKEAKPASRAAKSGDMKKKDGMMPKKK